MKIIHDLGFLCKNIKNFIRNMNNAQSVSFQNSEEIII